MTTRVWKIALLTWLALWPTVTVMMWFVQPHLRGLPVPVQALVLSGLIVPLMFLASENTYQRQKQKTNKNPL